MKMISLLICLLCFSLSAHDAAFLHQVDEEVGAVVDRIAKYPFWKGFCEGDRSEIIRRGVEEYINCEAVCHSGVSDALLRLASKLTSVKERQTLTSLDLHKYTSDKLLPCQPCVDYSNHLLAAVESGTSTGIVALEAGFRFRHHISKWLKENDAMEKSPFKVWVGLLTRPEIESEAGKMAELLESTIRGENLAKLSSRVKVYKNSLDYELRIADFISDPKKI